MKMLLRSRKFIQNKRAYIYFTIFFNLTLEMGIIIFFLNLSCSDQKYFGIIFFSFVSIFYYIRIIINWAIPSLLILIVISNST